MARAGRIRLKIRKGLLRIVFGRMTYVFYEKLTGKAPRLIAPLIDGRDSARKGRIPSVHGKNRKESQNLHIMNTIPW